ncbi:receptor protein [Salix suchowensis]|nr:receptor protein [Salix suchowensis]
MLFIFSCILLHLASLTIAQTNLLDHNCPNDVGNYTTNSDFQRNLNSALSSLDSNTQIDYGFYNLSVGQPGPDQANVIALCRGDIGVDECQNCIGNSLAKILQVCPKQKEAFGIADTCILRYSNKSIFGVMEDNPVYILYNVDNATDVNQFNQGLQTLMTRLRSTAASGNSFQKFATGNETAGFVIIFGLVQCTPDLSELQCDNCLAGVIRVIGQLVGSQGARITAPSCNLRYEIYRFFGVTPATIQLPASPSPQSPSVSPPPPPGSMVDKQENKNKL